MERFQQRQRQNDDFNNRHDATSCKFPERRLRNVVTPEGLPLRDGRPVNTKQRRKLVDPARRWTLPHGADQNHHGTKVDLSAEKTVIFRETSELEYGADGAFIMAPADDDKSEGEASSRVRLEAPEESARRDAGYCPELRPQAPAVYDGTTSRAREANREGEAPGGSSRYVGKDRAAHDDGEVES